VAAAAGLVEGSESSDYFSSVFTTLVISGWMRGAMFASGQRLELEQK
jgi:hypothetical protein